MMFDFNRQQRLHRELLKVRPTLHDGLELTFDRFVTPRPGLARLTRGSCEQILDRWVSWLERLLASHPPPPTCEVLWFESPDVMNPPQTSVAAYARLGLAMESFGTEDACVWPSSADEHAAEEWYCALPELEPLLEAMLEESDLAGGEDETADAEEDALAISHACALLLALNGLPRTTACASFAGPRGIAVLIGFKSGGVAPVGQLRGNAWGPIRRGRAKPIVLSELSAESRHFLAKDKPKRFVALGGDINQRDERGRTPLMSSAYEEPKQIRALLDAGADATLRDEAGNSLLHIFSACEIETLRQLIDRGADPRGVNDKGETVLHRLLRDGRCTAAHLEFYESVGLPLPPPGRSLSDAMSCITSYGTLYDPAGRQRRALLSYLTNRGHDINARDEQQRTPIWLLLERYAERLAEPYRRSDWTDYGEELALELLLEFGADPNVAHAQGVPPFIPRGATPLMVQRYESPRMIQALLKHGADPHARCAAGLTALEYAMNAAAHPHAFGQDAAARCADVLRRAMSSNGRS